MKLDVIENTDLQARITAFFSEKLNLHVPSIETDLVQTKILDSLGIVDLLIHLEQEFGIEIPLEDMEIDDLRSIAKIAEFIDSHTN